MRSGVIVLLTKVQAVTFVWLEENGVLRKVPQFPIYDHPILGKVEQVWLIDEAWPFAV